MGQKINIKNNSKFSHYINYISGTGRTIKTIMCYENTSLKKYAKDLKKNMAEYVYKGSCIWWEKETGRKTYERIPKYVDYGVE
ncbi:hypothetical protein KAH94_03170 [bacterium]|nr:hypothetical protein [bacterium]